jgi:hypothetical protein
VQPYEWVVLRVVPRVERGEFVNAGVIVYCQQRDYLRAGIELDDSRALALDAALDIGAVRRHLDGIRVLCEGRPEGGDNAARPPGDRFRWLSAPRSTVVQPSPIHTGVTDDPDAELERLLDRMVRRGSRPPSAA